MTFFTLGPRWLMPPMVLATSPAAIRDILGAKDASLDKTTPVFNEMRRIIGATLPISLSSGGCPVDAPYNQFSPNNG